LPGQVRRLLGEGSGSRRCQHGGKARHAE